MMVELLNARPPRGQDTDGYFVGKCECRPSITQHVECQWEKALCAVHATVCQEAIIPLQGPCNRAFARKRMNRLKLTPCWTTAAPAPVLKAAFLERAKLALTNKSPRPSSLSGDSRRMPRPEQTCP